MYIICVRYSNSPGYDGGATEREKPVTTNRTTLPTAPYATETVVIADYIWEIHAATRAAVAKVGDNARWARAIEKGAGWLLSRESVRFDRSTHTLVVPSESGSTYLANGVCQCQAHGKGYPCYHRAAARLVTRAMELYDGTRKAGAATPPAPVARPSIDDLFND